MGKQMEWTASIGCLEPYLSNKEEVYLLLSYVVSTELCTFHGSSLMKQSTILLLVFKMEAMRLPPAYSEAQFKTSKQPSNIYKLEEFSVKHGFLLF